jgi:4,5-dihydroxyphthalate decarboxylase
VTPLRTVLADYPHVRDLKNGTLDGPRFEFIEVDPVHRAFPAMVREQAYDVCEMAIVTYLQARAEGKPLLLLPVVLRSRFQHDHLVCLADNPIGPGDLAGKRIGVRTYAQTTGVWLRGILADQYDVPLDEVQWVSIEDGHLAEFRDPEQVERAPEGSKLVELLYAGELDAVIMGQDLPDDPRLVPVIPEPKAAAEDWYRRENAVPINHMVVVRADLAAERPGLTDDLFDLFARAKKNAPQPAGIDMTPIGLPANQRALELVTRYAYDQGLIPRRLAVSELFG